MSESAANLGPDGTGANDLVPNYSGQLMQVTEDWILDGDAVLCRKCT